MVDLPNGKPVLLIDGVCSLCRASVMFVIKRDPHGRFQFASQQSPAGQGLLQASNMNNAPALSSVYLLDEAGIHAKSTAVLRTLKGLKFPWPALFALIIIPRPIRDSVYDFIGLRRYAWFGKMDACWTPDAHLRERFLDV